MRPLTHVARLLVQIYRFGLSPVLPKTCRFEPTCSAYALEAIDRYGWLRGSGLAVSRIVRCHPWGDSGYDPVPDRPCLGTGPTTTRTPTPTCRSVTDAG